MEAVSVATLRKELKYSSQEELVEICLKLAKFKKENKELLTYVLFEASDEDNYVQQVKDEVDVAFAKLNHTSLYYVKKSLRKILRTLKKYIRYSKKKETEAALLLYFCAKLQELKPSHRRSLQISNMYDRQLGMAKKAVLTLHEDLQYDFQLEIEELEH